MGNKAGEGGGKTRRWRSRHHRSLGAVWWYRGQGEVWIKDFLKKRETDLWVIHLGGKDPGEVKPENGIITEVESTEGGSENPC